MKRMTASAPQNHKKTTTPSNLPAALQQIADLQDTILELTTEFDEWRTASDELAELCEEQVNTIDKLEAKVLAEMKNVKAFREEMEKLKEENKRLKEDREDLMVLMEWVDGGIRDVGEEIKAVRQKLKSGEDEEED